MIYNMRCFMKKVLLIEPNYPHPYTSRYHKNSLPNALLKLGSYYKSKGYEVKLLRLSGQDIPIPFNPDLICITSLFTYWIDYVKEAVDFAREFYPDAIIEVGGICATLQPDYTKEYTKCDKVVEGIVPEAEKFPPDYSLLKEEPDFQIITASRGCNRTCKFCATYKIENQTFKKSIRKEIFKRNIIFYDNNFLANPYIENILKELIREKRSRRILHCDSISGFDGRILKQKPYLGKWLKLAGFINPKIAWDHGYNQWESIKQQLDILVDAGFNKHKIHVFMLYNYDLPYEELEKKRVALWDYGVSVAHCRFRPHNQYFDKYHGAFKKQGSEDYYIHPNWTDKQVRTFAANVNKHNVCIRYDAKYYSNAMRHKNVPYELAKKVKPMCAEEAKKYLDDVFDPSQFVECKKEELK